MRVHWIHVFGFSKFPFLLVGLFLIWVAAPVFAASSPPLLKITLIDPKGSTQTVHWKSVSEWVWEEKPKSRPTLKLRHRILLPENFRVPNDRNRSTPHTILKDTSYEDPSGNWIEFFSTDEAMNFSVDQKEAKGQVVEKVLLFTMTGVQESFLAHPTCEEAGYELTSKDLPPKAVHGLGAFCEMKNGKLVIYFSHDSGLNFEKFIAPSKNVVKKGKETPQGVPFLFDPKAASVDKGKLLAGFVFKSASRPLVYQISLREGAGSGSKFGVAAALGPTYISFVQNPGNINVSQLVLTAKLFGTYQLSKNWSFGLGAFGTVLNLMTSPESLPPARFIGINARVGYLFDQPLVGIRWSLSAGWYYTGMTVQDRIYGINSLLGPQIYLFGLSTSQRVFFYLKYAPISTSASFPTFKSNEIAAGGGYRLSSLSEKSPWQITTDFSYLKIGDPVGTTIYDITWMTISVSIQKTFRF